jgi:hypothetical protein
MKYLVILMAPYLLVTFIAETKLGRQRQAYYLTLSFKCYLIILHNKVTVCYT